MYCVMVVGRYLLVMACVGLLPRLLVLFVDVWMARVVLSSGVISRNRGWTPFPGGII